MDSDTLIFFVNGQKVEDSAIDPRWTLLEYLRSKLRLCGTKLACGQGGCGACTVMLSKYCTKAQQVQHMSASACLIPICYVHGHSVITIEGLGSSVTKLHPIQERLAKAHGSQCGFCSPGFVMSMYALLRNNPEPSYEQLEQQLQGNLCRCTGYRPIMEGFRSFLYQNGEPMKLPTCCQYDDSTKSNCCQKEAAEPGGGCCTFTTQNVSYNLMVGVDYAPYDPSQEIIFPPYLQLHPNLIEDSAVFVNEHVKWFSPDSLEQLTRLRSQYPEAKLLGGCNLMVQQIKAQNSEPSVYLIGQRVKKLVEIEMTDNHLKIGAAVTATALQRFLKQQMDKVNGGKRRYFSAMLEMIKQYSCQQTRNTACIGGIVMTHLSSADFLTILTCLETSFNFESQGKQRSMVISSGQHPIDIILPDEVLVSISIPHAADNEHVWFYKQAVRYTCSPAIVSAGFKTTFFAGSTKVEKLRITYGEVAPRLWILETTMEEEKSREWNQDLAEEICSRLTKMLPEEISHYKRSLAISCFFKFFLSVKQELENNNHIAEDQSRESIPQSAQLFQKVSMEQSDINPIGRPVVHTSAFKQACGEAQYVADIMPREGELHAAPVLSTCALADIEAIDTSKALSTPGVKGFFSAYDIKDSENAIDEDSHFFAPRKVGYFGQLVGVVVAINRRIAKAAALLVEVKYSNHRKPILSLEEAIEKDSYHLKDRCMEKGDVEGALKESENVLQGEVFQPGQTHMYMEPIAVVATPKDASEMDIWVTSQSLHILQMRMANLLGVPANHVTVHCKRIGGGFGGKELDPLFVAGAAAIAAKKLGTSVRFIMDMAESLKMLGGRHPYRTTYQVGFHNDGKLNALDISYTSNGGYFGGISYAGLGLSMLNGCGSYASPNVRIRGAVCKTNVASNVPMRGFGVPQAAFMIETIIDHVAQFLKKPPHEIRELNFIDKEHMTHYHQHIDGTNLLKCWQECLRDSRYKEKLQEVEEFNRNNEWKKRGVSLIPHVQGVGAPIPYACFGGALVNIYTDGSVLVAHGGIEMGQGLSTKTMQVASTVLKVPITKIHFEESNTSIIPNAYATIGSHNTDIYGAAVLEACEELLNRLKPIIKENPDGQWEDWVKAAHFNRINLSATGFHRVPDMTFDPSKSPGRVLSYHSFGAACTEVEVDCLTGHHKVLSCHIVMDVGESLNPAIDIGQIEGSWMKGYGRLVMEQPLHSDEGEVLSYLLVTYPIPSFSNMPTNFTVSLLRGSSNPRAVYSSKGTGEPPLCLSSAAYFAIKRAITSARDQRGLPNDYRLDIPATPERIRLLCQDNFTEMAKTKT